MFKVGTVAGLTSVQCLVQDAPKDGNKEGKAKTARQNSTALSARNLNGAHHGGEALVEIQNFTFLLLFFLIFFSISVPLK